MKTIYHLALRQAWEANPQQAYRPDSLAGEGFIHCSNSAQVAGAANRFYAGQQDLLVLHIDPARLTSPVQEEPSASGERFPHIYGPLNRDAVVVVQPLARGPDGCWQFSAS
jgi:uncharacterized protein (DUF952 family)